MLRKSFVLLVVGTVMFFLSSISSADIPDSISYQGKLTTASGGCLDDTVQMTFTIYSDELGVSDEWSETQTQVVVKEGIFSVFLGSVNPLPDTLFDGSVKYLGVQVESDPEMKPLKPMVTTAYAFHCATADSALNAPTAGIESVDGVSNPSGDVDLIQQDAITIIPNDGANNITFGETHSARTDNPHAVTASQTGALVSSDGVSNPGGDVDFIQNNSITITPNDGANTITFGETHSTRTDNPHAVTASQTGALVSSDGVSNPGGNVDFIQNNSITITPNDGANTITFGETHSARTDNPHAVTAAQTGALVSVDGVNNAGGDVDFVAGSNMTITPNDEANTITFSSTAIGIGGSGSANYIPKFTASATIGNSAIYQNGNNIGIGTTSPGSYMLNVNGSFFAPTVNTGQGNYELYAMNQNVQTSDSPTFVTVNTGQGANELYSMNQNVRTSDNVTFNRIALSDYGIALGGFHVGGTGDPGSDNLIVDGKLGVGTSPSYRLHVSTSTSHAGYFTSNYLSSSTNVIHSEFTASGNYDACAVYGKCRPADYFGYGGYFEGGYYGVYGKVAPTGSSAYRAVYGTASGGSGTNYGVYGHASGSGTNFGVYYSGGLGGSGSKSCVVKTSQGPTLLYCQESPENWFEDFGEGWLVNGKAHVVLDALFLETVTIDAAHPMKVFVQLEGDCNGVYVSKGTTSFDVIELRSGTSNVPFSYRVVAKRKGFEDKRLDYTAAGENDPYLYPEAAERMEKERQQKINGEQ